jgi:GH24 family phage-related lysozyme (muramidase)
MNLQNPQQGLLGQLQPQQNQAQVQPQIQQPPVQADGLLKQGPEQMQQMKLQEDGQNLKKQIQDHIVLREGNKEESYLDSLGILHAGIGHRLSKEEQQLYPKGTVVPEEVRNAWFEDDSAKSTKAAYDQAQELQAPSLIPALASVNFQLGTAWTEKFPTAYEHLKNGDYESAIQEIENTSKGSGKLSTWNKQTPVRVTDFVASIRELAQLKQRA